MKQRKILAEIRQYLGLTQVKMSKVLGVAYITYQHLEYEIRNIQLCHIEAIANAIPNLDLDALIRNSEFKLKKGGEK